MTSKDVEKTVSKKVKTKNNIGGADPSDIHNQGKDLFEQAFSSH